MAAYHHEEGFLIHGTPENMNRVAELFGRLRVLELFVKENSGIYAEWIGNGLQKGKE